MSGWEIPGRVAALALGCLAAIACLVTPADAQQVGYTASLYASRTTYPVTSDRVTNVSIFNSVDVGAGPVRVSVSVPFVRWQTAFTTASDGTPLPTEFDETSSGFGDPLVRVDLAVVDRTAGGLHVAIAGAVKPAIVSADEGLGTGEADVAAGGSVFKAIGRTSVFGDVMFWTYGDPDGVDFQDSLSYSLGVGRVLGDRWSGLVSVSGFSQGIAELDPPVQLNLAVIALASRHQSIAITAGVGLTGGAEDLSIGTSWRIWR